MSFKTIFDSIITFILSLYSNSAYPRKLVQDFVDYMNDFIINIYLPSVKQDVMLVLNKYNIIPKYVLSEVNECFENYSSVFDGVLSEHKRFELFKKLGYIDYELYDIGYTFALKDVKNKMRLVPENMYGIYVPLRTNLKMFLEVPGILNETFEYMNKLYKESNVISNIIQGKLWSGKYFSKFTNDYIVLPLYLFYDDLEVGNGLGSHAGKNKFGAIYVSIACLPPHIASRLSSILFCGLVHTEDKKKLRTKKYSKKL